MKITRTATREEWLAERLDLLAEEKAASRQLAMAREGFGLRCRRRCHAEHLPVPRSDAVGPAALHQRMALARHVWGTGST